MQDELEQIHLRKTQFVQKYGPHDIVHDIDALLSEVHSFRAKEKEYGFMTMDKMEMIQAFRHMCTRTHQHDPISCSMCREAEKVVKEIREHKI